MNEIELRSEKLARACAEKLDLEIVEVEYVKERGIKILRILPNSTLP